MRTFASILACLFGMCGPAWAEPIGIGNVVWNDFDADGLQDPTEPGLPGVRVQLWNAATTQLFASAETNAAGRYQLLAPSAGSYRVRVLLPSAAAFSPKDAGSSDELDSDINPDGSRFGFTDAYTLAANVIEVTHVDAGIVLPRPVAIGDSVWYDKNRDGVQGAGEPGLPGVTVQLWNEARNALLDSTVTDEDGAYALLTPDRGSYRVRVLVPSAAYVFSPMYQGGSDTRDSNVHPTGLQFGFTDALLIDGATTLLTSIDAGLGGPHLFDDGFE